MTIYYHGTTMENAKSILKEGFNSESAVWECSDPLATYFYRSDINDTPKEGLKLAIENAQIASAVSGVQDTSVAVIVADIPDSVPAYPDRSCENMENVAVEIETELLNLGIDCRKIKISMLIFPETYCPGMRFFYLKDLSFLELSDFSDFEFELIQTLSQIDTADELYYLLLLEPLDRALGSIENESEAA